MGALNSRDARAALPPERFIPARNASYHRLSVLAPDVTQRAPAGPGEVITRITAWPLPSSVMPLSVKFAAARFLARLPIS